MKTLRLYDPTRRPPDWTAQLTASQYAAFFRDVKTGEELTADGRPPAGDEPSTCLVFDSLDEATDFCRRRVEQSERLQCDIYDHYGKAKPPARTVIHPRFAGRLPSRRKVRLMVLIAVLLVLPAPWLFWLDARHSLVLVFPTFLGINLIVIALRLLYWAYASHQELRRLAGTSN